MGGYLQKKRNAVAATPSGDGGPPRRQSQASETLVQFRNAMDASAAVQRHAALQRALDQALARDDAAPHETQATRPALQRKGIAINDDAGLEHEADVMGAQAARHDGPAGAHPLTSVAQAIGAASQATAIQRVTGGDTKVKEDPKPRVGLDQDAINSRKLTIKKYANVNKRSLKEATKTDELGLSKLINALEQSIQDRKKVQNKYTQYGYSDPSHKKHDSWKGHKYRIESEQAILDKARDALKKLRAAKTVTAPAQTDAKDAKDSKEKPKAAASPAAAAPTSNSFAALDVDADD